LSLVYDAAVADCQLCGFMFRAILYVMHGTFAHFQDMPQIIVYNLETEFYVVRQHSRHR